MADAPIAPLARNVIAHCCSTCTCSDVERPLHRTGSGSSEASVGTGTSRLLPAGSEHSGGSVRSGARYRGPAGSGGGAGTLPVNGHVQVNVGGSARARGVDSDASGEEVVEGEDGEDDEELCAADVVASNLEELYSGRHPKLKLAFDDWEKTFDTFQKRREYKEAQRDAIRNEIYQVIGFYVVFQGVIFTAVAQASVLHCKNWWTSFLLSLLTSLVTIAVVVQKLQDFYALEKTIASVKSSSKVLQTRINEVKLKLGPELFDFKKHAKDGKSKDLIVPVFTVKLYRFMVITVLLCFSILFLVSSWSILCRPELQFPRGGECCPIMSHTEIINKTRKPLKLKVGNNLVFTDLTVVPKDSSYRVDVDPNSTYQEYLMGKDRNGRPVIISSDDCADNKSITVMEDEDGSFRTVKKARNAPSRSGLSATTSSSSRATGSTKAGGSKVWLGKIMNSFRSSS